MAKRLRTFRLEDEEWSAFQELCDSRSESASEAIRRLILDELNGPTGVIRPAASPKPAPKAPKSPKSAPKAPKTAPQPAPASPQGPENDWSDRMNRFSKGAQAARGKKQ